MTTITETRNRYQRLRAEGRFHGTLKRALELRKQRDANRPHTRDFLCRRSLRISYYYAMREELERGVEVPIGDELESQLLDIVKRRNPKYRNWSGGVFAQKWVQFGWYSIWSRGSNRDWRKRSTFQRGIDVASRFEGKNTVCGTIHCGPHQREVKLPRGWVFSIDDNGLLVRRSKPIRGLGLCDYHPTAADMLRMSPKELVATARENARVRTAEDRRQLKGLTDQMRRAEREGATVCLADSLRAGNCYAGTVVWAARVGLVRNKHYKPSQVIKLAGKEIRRVMLVVRQAIRRHNIEMERGYANLADHRSG